MFFLGRLLNGGFSFWFSSDHSGRSTELIVDGCADPIQECEECTSTVTDAVATSSIGSLPFAG